eukprot:SAG11_NODE_3350_length_2507_cov_3.084302_4_plen_101_part_00
MKALLCGTGYRPILTAAHTFASEGCMDKTEIEGLPAAVFKPYDAATEPPPPPEMVTYAWAQTSGFSITATDGARSNPSECIPLSVALRIQAAATSHQSCS